MMIDKQNLSWGLKRGLIGGAILGAFAGAVILIRGGLPVDAPLSPIAIVAMYPAFGLVAGMVLGLFRPLLKTRAGAVGVVAVAVLPFTATFLHFSEKSLLEWSAAEWFLCLLASLLLASIGVFVFWGES